MKKILVAFAVVFVALIPALAALAAEEGVIDQVKGKAQIISDSGAKRPAKEGGFIHSGEAVETGPESMVRIILPDQSVLEIKESSRVEVEDSRANPSGINTVFVYLGSLWASISKSDTGDTKFEVQTPTAVAGVRGTVFTTGVGIDASTRLGVEQGRVHVNSAGGDTEVDNDKETSVVMNDPPSRPTPYQKGDDQWRNWHQSRQEELNKDPDKYLAWMANDVKSGPKKLDGLRADSENRDKELRQLAGQKNVDPKAAADHLNQTYNAAANLQRADRQTMAKYYLLNKVDEDAKKDPKAFNPNTAKAAQKNLSEAKSAGIEKVHRNNVAAQRQVVDRADNFTRGHDLGPQLQRKEIKDPRRELEHSRDNFRNNRPPEGPKPEKPLDKPRPEKPREDHKAEPPREGPKSERPHEKPRAEHPAEKPKAERTPEKPRAERPAEKPRTERPAEKHPEHHGEKRPEHRGERRPERPAERPQSERPREAPKAEKRREAPRGERPHEGPKAEKPREKAPPRNIAPGPGHKGGGKEGGRKKRR